MKQCKNILCVQNHNVVLALNECYAFNPKWRMTGKSFMKLQLGIWKQVKKNVEVAIK